MVEVEQWSVFRRGQAGGNPCPVIAEARSLTSGQMQAIAAHYGHESAFVTSVAPSRVCLRFFVPRHEMRMCVHATIAAITALAGSGSIAGGEAVAVTASGEHRVSWACDEEPDVTVEQSAPVFGPPSAVHAEVTLALGLPGQPSWVRAAALAGPDGTTRTSVTGRAVRTGHVQLCLRAITAERDLPEPELR